MFINESEINKMGCVIVYSWKRDVKKEIFNIPREVIKLTKPLWSEKIEIFERNNLGKSLFY